MKNKAIKNATVKPSYKTRPCLGMSNVASQITETEVLPVLKLFVMPTNVERIVTIKGSLLGGQYFSPNNNKVLAGVLAEMLDQGTEKYAKKELHDLLDSRGISINFSASRFQITISARCLFEDTTLTFELVAEMLRRPTFPESELDVLRKRAIGEIKEQQSNTRAQAGIALSRKLYSPSNPNCALSGEETIAFLEKITRNDLVSFHKKLGLGNMYLVAVGDVDTKNFSVEVEKYFSGWQKSAFFIPDIAPAEVPKGETTIVPIPDKTSADVMLGTTIPFGDQRLDFYPLVLGTNILGGGFTARLMQEVRDKKGLPYGTYSSVSGTGNNTPGHFVVWGTFAPELLDKGLEALNFETKKFIARGVNVKELAGKKQTITGGYKVGLSTTGGLASVILANAEAGKPKEFIDEYPRVIEKITLTEVNKVIKKYLDVKNLVTVIA